MVLLLSARYLGSEVVGQVSVLILNIAVIQTVNEIYTGPALVYFIPKNSLARIYVQGALFALVCTLLLNLGFWLLDKVQHAMGIHLLLLSFIITINAFNNVVLLAREKIRSYNFLVLLQPLLLLLTMASQVFVFHNKSLSAYLVSLYVSFGVTLLLSKVLLLPVFRNAGHDGKIIFADVLQNGFMNQLGNLAHTLSNRLNYYLLGSAALVGVYASSTSLIEGIWIISGSVSPIVLSYVANQKNPENNARLTLVLSKLCFLLGLFCVAVLWLLPADVFTNILGKDFEQTKMVMLYLAPGVLCLSFSSVISHYFSGLGKQMILLSANATGLLFTVCAAWPFIHVFGLAGACYAASGAYFVQALVLTLLFFRQNKFSLSELISLRGDISLLKNK